METTPAMPRDFDRHFRRAVWAVAAVIMTAAAVVHAGKADDGRSAFIRWRPQVREFWRGVNIYEARFFPNPPIMPITLTPFAALPPVPGAMAWFALKVALTAASVAIAFGWVRRDGRPLPSWFQAGVLLFCLRPVLSDLHHGNNNLVILFLVVAALEAWRRGYDVLAGLVLALSVAYKVTPALLVVFFLAKRSWRAAGATVLGVGVFLLIVPAVVVGPQFNAECLGAWWQHILRPFLAEGGSSPQEMNQSMVGVLTRLLTATPVGTGRYDLKTAVNFVAWDPRTVGLLIKGLSVALVAALGATCLKRPGERRDDPRLVGEFALVVLTMLFVSERSWKHHYVTLLLPYTYLMARFAFGGLRPAGRVAVAAAMWGSVGLMATTSTEIGGVLFGHGEEGHKLAQGYGLFLWAGVVLYAATLWQVRASWRAAGAGTTGATPTAPAPARAVPAPHFAPGGSRPSAPAR